jgi:rsbT antagonist protein RsbS
MAEAVAVLHQGENIIAAIQSDLTDEQVIALRDDISARVGRSRARGVIVDVTSLDVIDSFVARALRSLALTAKLRGAETIVVGIRPEVAIAMVQFEMNLAPLRTAIDLDEALEILAGERRSASV